MKELGNVDDGGGGGGGGAWMMMPLLLWFLLLIYVCLKTIELVVGFVLLVSLVRNMSKLLNFFASIRLLLLVKLLIPNFYFVGL